MISLTPLFGNKKETVFTFSITPSSDNPIINWGDGGFSYTNTATHTYNNNGIYNVYGGTCLETSAFQVSVYNGIYLDDNIDVSFVVNSAYTSCANELIINLTSINPINTIQLYSSGSNSIPYTNEITFWNHLNPYWRFSDVENNYITEFSLTGSPILSGNITIGYSALSSIYYTDDMPGQPLLIFTLKKDEHGFPINSRIYDSIQYYVSATIPDKLFITADGLNPINAIQWADLKNPYVISVGSSQNSCTNVLHYMSGYITGIKFTSECFGIDNSNYITPLCSMELIDNNCFPVGGYIITDVVIPSSALPSMTITNNLDECQQNIFDVEYTKVRKTPKNTVLSATGIFSYNGIEYSLSGISDPFNVVAFENRHEFFRKGEDISIYDLAKQSLPFNIEQYSNFNTYLSAICGEGDTLGKVYDKIVNFAVDHSDADLCVVESLISNAEMLDFQIDDFGLEFPEELRRLFNFSTIPLQKLIGTRQTYNMNDSTGDQLTLNDYVTAGQTILYKEIGSNVFNYLYITPLISTEMEYVENLEITTEDIFSITTEDDQVLSIPYNNFIETTTISNEYKLKFLQNSIIGNNINNFCFYKLNQNIKTTPIDSVINYNDDRNLLDSSLITNDEWYGDNGILEEIFNYILTKNLINNSNEL